MWVPPILRKTDDNTATKHAFHGEFSEDRTSEVTGSLFDREALRKSLLKVEVIK